MTVATGEEYKKLITKENMKMVSACTHTHSLEPQQRSPSGCGGGGQRMRGIRSVEGRVFSQWS